MFYTSCIFHHNLNHFQLVSIVENKAIGLLANFLTVMVKGNIVVVFNENCVSGVKAAHDAPEDIMLDGKHVI